MKQILLLISTFIILSSSCRKDKPKNPVDELPPETQIGANTFGCLIDGKVFKPGGLQLSGGSLNCSYQLTYNDPVNGNIFGISAGYKSTNGEIKDIGFRLDSVNVMADLTYPLSNQTKGGGYGQYSFYGTIGLSDIYQTTNIIKGSVSFKRFDLTSQIASGTFWFDAVNAAGQKVEVREGRFDVRYTR
jgi:hypothetical protein